MAPLGNAGYHSQYVKETCMASGSKKSETIIPVSEALRLRTTPTVCDTMPLDESGTVIRYEFGNPPVAISTIDKIRLKRDAAATYLGKLYRDKIAPVQNGRITRIKEIVERYPSIRSIDSLRARSRVNVTPKTSIDWDPDKLRETLGVAYPNVVDEEVVVTFNIPRGYNTNEGPFEEDTAQRLIRLGAAALGIPEEDILTGITAVTELRVSQGKLYDMVKEGRVNVDDAGTATRTWAVEAKSL